MTLARNFYRIVKASNSPFEIALREAGQLVSSEGITRADLVFNRPGVAAVNISSSQDPTWFDLEHDAVVDGKATKVIRVDLKDTTIAEGRYEVDVFAFDAVNTAGRYSGTIDVEVEAANPAAS